MRAVFLGTPPAAVPALRALVGVADVAVVVTRPDRPRGRSRRPVPSAVSAAASEWNLPVAGPDSSEELAATLEGCGRFDVALVVAYGRLIPARLLTLPAAGFVNVHFSVLPRWRGAAPVQRALLAGDSRTGVTLMRLDAGLDTGPILTTTSTRIGPFEDAGALTNRLAALGADSVSRWLAATVQGRVAGVDQDPGQATHAPKLRSDERWVDVRADTAALLAAVRGLAPWPGAWVRHPTGAVRIHAAVTGDLDLEPGELHADGDAVTLGSGDGSLRLLTVQPEGKRPMPAADWARGLRDRLGGVS